MHSALRLALIASTWWSVAAAQAPQVRLELLQTLSADTGEIHAAGFSPSGDALACGGELGDVVVYEWPSGELRWRSQPSDHWFGVVRFSASGRWLACLGRDLTIHDAATGAVELRIKKAGPHGFAWAPDTDRFAYSGAGGVRVRGVHEDDQEQLWGKMAARSLAFEADGSIVAGTHRGEVWRIPKGGGEGTLLHDHRTRESDMVRMIAVAAAGEQPLEATSDRAVVRGDRTFEPPGDVFALATTSDGATFAAGGQDASDLPLGIDLPKSHHTVRVWTEHGAASRDFEVPGAIVSLAMHPNGRDLFVATTSGHQALYRDGKLHAIVPGVPKRIRRSCLSKDGSCVALQANRWQLRSLQDGRVRPLADAISVQQGPQDSQFLVTEARRVVQIDGRSGAELAEYDGVTFSGIGATPAVLGPPGFIMVDSAFRDRTNKVAAELPKRWINMLAGVSVAPDGGWAIGGISGVEAETGVLLVTDADGSVRGSVDDVRVTWLTFSPNGTRLFYGSLTSFPWSQKRTGVLRVLDAKTLEVRQSMSINCTHWHFLDAHRALACVDGKLEVWSVDKMAPIQSIELPEPCYGFQLSQECDVLLTGNAREVRVHRVHLPGR